MKLWALCLAMTCCGGTVATTGDGGADASTGDSSAHDATPTSDTGPAVDCTALQAEIDKLRNDAITCCPFCNSQQCGHAVDDLCCQISVTAASAPAFSMAVAQFKAQCTFACPATPCRMEPSFNCKPVDPQNPSSRGTCQ